MIELVLYKKPVMSIGTRVKKIDSKGNHWTGTVKNIASDNYVIVVWQCSWLSLDFIGTEKVSDLTIY